MKQSIALLTLLPIVLLGAGAIGWAWEIDALRASAEARLLMLCITVLWALLVLPAGMTTDNAGTPAFVVASVLVGIAGFGLMLWVPSRSFADVPAAQSAASVAVLVFAASGMARLMARLGLNWHASWTLVFLLAVTTGLAPLWLGPLLEVAAADQWFVDATIALSPMSHIATLLDWDYLRSDWFYRHSPFGGLRYTYPHPATFLTFYLIMGAATHLLADLAQRADRPSRFHHPLTI